MKVLGAGMSAGSLLFWMPALLMRATMGSDWTVLVLPYNAALPIWVFVMYAVLRRRLRVERLAFAFSMLFGIWLTGPFWMTVEFSFSTGEGFHKAGSLFLVLWETLLFPATTYIMSTYEGSLFALTAVTVGLPVIAIAKGVGGQKHEGGMTVSSHDGSK